MKKIGFYLSALVAIAGCGNAKNLSTTSLQHGSGSCLELKINGFPDNTLGFLIFSDIKFITNSGEELTPMTHWAWGGKARPSFQVYLLNSKLPKNENKIIISGSIRYLAMAANIKAEALKNCHGYWEIKKFMVYDTDGNLITNIDDPSKGSTR